jgi:hypothetical protein
MTTMNRPLALQRLAGIWLLALVFCLSSIAGFAEPFGVRYTLEGFLDKHDTIFVLHTEDGRVFELIIDAKDAKSLLGERVKLEGKAHRGDDIATIKVQKIAACPAPEQPVPPIEYADYQKPARLLSASDEQVVIQDVRWGIGQDPATTTLKARHTWENVTIRPEMLDDAYFVLKPFFPELIAAHSLFVFSFKPGGMTSASGEQAQALALTIEAYKKLGQSYGLIKCFKKNFDIVWNLTTWANYATLNVRYNTSKDKQLLFYPLKITREQKLALLRETIKQACVNRKGEYYHTTRNNCTNNLVMLLNSVLPAGLRTKLWTIPGMVYNFKATMPISVGKMLRKKGLIGEPLPAVTPKNFTTEIPVRK